MFVALLDIVPVAKKEKKVGKIENKSVKSETKEEGHKKKKGIFGLW